MKLSSENLKIMAGISHEIRNPINAIIGIAHLLQKENQKEVQEELLHTLLVTSENLRELTNNILDFTKLEEGKVPRSITSIDIRKEIRMILFGHEAMARAKGLELVIDIDDNVPSRVMLDKVRGMQILINLVSNAIKFTQEGRITLEVKALEISDSEVNMFFAVRDTGMGIPEEKQQQIFEPFRQGGSSINAKHGGTGLGLSIADMLITSSGGKLMLKSKISKGSEFSFIVPLKLPANLGVDLREEKPVSLAKDPRNLKVLIVDDNKINQLVASKTFENWGIEFAVAHNGIEAVAKVQEDDFAVVLMDLQMPKMNGYDATCAIRNLENKKFLSLPIIALSGSAGCLEVEDVIATGFSGYLAKPYNPKELLEKIMEVVGERN